MRSRCNVGCAIVLSWTVPKRRRNETCAGQTVKCGLCTKAVKRNQSRASCSLCLKIFHLRCYGSDVGESLCNSCYLSNSDGQVNFDQMRQGDFQQYDIPELREFSSKKGLKILHQNIRGLLTNKHNICQILDGLKNLHIFSLSETHLSADNEVEAQIEGYTFIGKSRSSGKGGGVGVYISTSVPFHRRTDLEDEVIECIWIEILFPKTKSFLLELFTALQILQNIFALISIANLNQCFRQCHQKTKNVFLLVI